MASCSTSSVAIEQQAISLSTRTMKPIHSPHGPHRPVIPYVEDRRNAILLEFQEPHEDKIVASLKPPSRMRSRCSTSLRTASLLSSRCLPEIIAD